MNKPPKSGNAKKKMLNHPTIISPLGVCTWKIAVNAKYNIEAKMINLLPTMRLAQSIWKHEFPSIDKLLQKGL